MTARGAYPLVLIVAGGAILFLLGNGRVPLWDRDEPRYAQCSRQMLQSGDWVVPRFLDELRAHKPPLIYWCQATAMSLLGQTGAAARLPSALGMTATAGLLSWFARRNADRRRAIWATAVFCTCLLTIAAAKLCITDAVLLLLISIGQGCLYMMWRGGRTGYGVAIAFWVSTALAGLTKGPVVLAMHAALMLVLSLLDCWKTGVSWREAVLWWRRTRPLLGLVILMALVAPWLILVQRRAPDFLPRLLSRTGRYASGGAEGHAHWPGFYLLMIWATLFPWSLLLPTSIGVGLRHRDQPLLRFSLAAAIGPWLVMELVVNKLPFYILPSFPALAILTAEAIVRCGDATVGAMDGDLKRRSFLVGVAVWGAAMLGVAILPVLAISKLGGSEFAAIAWAAASVICMATVAGLFMRRRVAGAAGCMAGGMAVLTVIVFAAILPSLTPLSASRDIGRKLNDLGAGGATRVAMIDYREPSLAFYQGGGARDTDATAFDSPSPPVWAVMTTEAWDRLDPATQLRYDVVEQPRTVLIYNDGWRIERLVIVRRRV